MARKCRGETIAETLVSMLISALSLLLLVTMIQSSAKLITNSEEAMDKNIQRINALNEPATAREGNGVTVGEANLNVTGDITIDDGDSIKVKYALDPSAPAVSYVKSDSP